MRLLFLNVVLMIHLGASVPTDTPQSSSPLEFDPYPIVPTFQQWRFPHDNLPPSWQNLPPADNSAIRSGVDAVRLRDGSCRITEFEDECEVAHLCPRQEEAWFSMNEMYRYGATSPAAIDSPSNLVLLRSDVHKIFDKKSFVFIPKLDETICIHVLSELRQQRSLYHNTKLHPVTIGAEYLFTRFAWAIFPQLSQFLQRRKRTLLALSDGTTAWADGTETAGFVKPQQSRTSSPTKQSRSPTKRSRTQFEDMQDNDYAPVDSDRGRKRWRSDEQRGGAGTFDKYHSPSTPLLDNSQSTISTARTNNPDDKVDLCALIQESLLKERARSDPNGHWVKEQQWATGILDAGGALAREDNARFWRAMGCEDVNEIEEEHSLSEAF